MKVDNPEGVTWILWDGECGFCRRGVDWLMGHLDRSMYRATPFQRAPRPPMTDDIYAACSDAVHIVLPDGTVRRGGDACRYLLEESNLRWLGLSMYVPPISWLLEPGYRTVARNRMFFSKVLFRAGKNQPPRHDIGDWDCC